MAAGEQTAAGNDDGQSHWMIGSVGISQGCVTAPASPSPARAASLHKHSEGFLAPGRFCAGKAGIKPASPPVPAHRACPAQHSVPEAGQALSPVLPVLVSVMKIHDICFFTCKMPQGAQCPAEKCCHPWDKGLSPGAA